MWIELRGASPSSASAPRPLPWCHCGSWRRHISQYHRLCLDRMGAPLFIRSSANCPPGSDPEGIFFLCAAANNASVYVYQASCARQRCKSFLTLCRIAPTCPRSCLPLVNPKGPACRVAECQRGVNGFDTEFDRGRSVLRRRCRPHGGDRPVHRSRTSAGKIGARELSA